MIRLAKLTIAVAFILVIDVHPIRADAVERLGLERLRATHEQVAALAAQRREVSLTSQYDDYRAQMHVHSAFSHDSNGTIEEIVDAARAVGARVVMFSEHPAQHYDYFSDGHSGMRDGVLLIPGAETKGFLAYPTRSIEDEPTETPQAFSDLVQSTGGLSFVSHVEERMDWDITGSTGMEIYNTHADVKDETRLMAMMRDPLGLAGLSPAFAQYPQEAFAALLDYPAQYLRRYDRLCQTRRVTGVAANDAHHNQGFRAVMDDDGTVRVEDALGEKLATLDPAKTPALAPLVAGRRSGDVVLALDLDPYEHSFRHTSTHLLINELSKAAVGDALGDGRVYVAFDWMADPTGFVCFAEQDGRPLPLGSETIAGEPLRIRAEIPLPGTIRLVHNGKVIEQRDSHDLDVTVEEPGVYRVEVLLTLVGEPRPWILTNPFYLRAAP
jgi:hypothetical protein